MSPSWKKVFFEKQMVLRVSRLRRVRKVRCLRSKLCNWALSSTRCSAGSRSTYAHQASVIQRATGTPACASSWRRRSKVAWVRRPKTKATTWPVSASCTHHSQRGWRLRPTYDHLSSACSRRGTDGGTKYAGCTGGRCLTCSIFFVGGP